MESKKPTALSPAFIPCCAAKEHVALENGTKQYAHKLYRQDGILKRIQIT